MSEHPKWSLGNAPVDVAAPDFRGQHLVTQCTHHRAASTHPHPMGNALSDPTLVTVNNPWELRLVREPCTLHEAMSPAECTWRGEAACITAVQTPPRECIWWCCTHYRAKSALGNTPSDCTHPRATNTLREYSWWLDSSQSMNVEEQQQENNRLTTQDHTTSKC